MKKGYLGIFLNLIDLDNNLIIDLKKLDYYIFIITNDDFSTYEQKYQFINFINPDKFDTLKIKLTYLIVINNLSYFIDYSFFTNTLFFWIKNEINYIYKNFILENKGNILYNNIKHLINYLKNDSLTQIDHANFITGNIIDFIIEDNNLIYSFFDYIPEFEGYTFLPNFDFYGNDIYSDTSGRTFSELKKIADGLKECKGFNTYGYFKNKIESKIYLKNNINFIDGFYIKNEFI